MATTPEQTTVWTIRPFPLRIKNQIVGLARMRGMNVPVFLEKILTQWLQNQPRAEIEDLSGFREEYRQQINGFTTSGATITSRGLEVTFPGGSRRVAVTRAEAEGLYVKALSYGKR